MTAFGWLLLEQLVHAEVWARAAAASPADPVALILSLLVFALGLAIARAGRRIARALRVAHGHRTRADGAHGQRDTRNRVAAFKPSGARGPRAPGVVLVV